MRTKVEIQKMIVFSAVIILTAVCLAGCDNTAQETSIPDSQVSIDTAVEQPVKMTETESTATSEKTPELQDVEEIDYSIPSEFVDYRKYIGADISVLHTDTSGWDYDRASQELWDGSFYGHTGKISVELGWDDKTITGFYLVLDDDNKISNDEREELHQRVSEIFGSDVDESMIAYEFSGVGDYSFQIPKTLEQESVCMVTWNDDLRREFMESKPQQEQPDEEEEYVPQKLEPQIGMTAEEVIQSTWGEPSDINKTTTRYGVKEQWVYDFPSKTRYIYLEDGIVTAIQE